MSDTGVTLNLGSGGKTVDTETLSPRGFEVQRVKVVVGAVDTDGGDVASGNPLPVAGAVSVTNFPGSFWQSVQPVSGTVSVSNFPATQPVSGTVGISGTVSVSGTFWQATQPVSAAALPLPANAAQETGGNLATVATAQGASGTGIVQPTGGSGILGWLSGIFNKLSGTLAVAWSGSPNVTVANATLAATQSGTWNIGSVTALPALPAGANKIGTVSVSDSKYQTVPASSSAVALTGGGGGAAGDLLLSVLIIPATTAAGAVSITDGGGSAITIFAGGGTTALNTLIPFAVPLNIKSSSGAWKITTGTNVSVIASGSFT